jgi:hypothetical protein
MQPVVKLGYTTRVLGAPYNWNEAKDGPCKGLPIAESNGMIHSYWQLSWKELLKLLFYREVRLTIFGKSHPPVALDLYK